MTRSYAQRRAIERLTDRAGLVSIARGYATREQAARILRERADIETAIATEVARMQGGRDE